MFTGARSRSKGKSFERHISHLIRETFGAAAQDCYRTPMSGGHQAMPGDIQIKGKLASDFPFVVECKHHKIFKIDMLFSTGNALVDAWLQQAYDAAIHDNKGRFPILVMRGNGTPIYCAVPLKLKTSVSRLRYRRWTVFRFSDFLSEMQRRGRSWLPPREDFEDVFELANMRVIAPPPEPKKLTAKKTKELKQIT